MVPTPFYFAVKCPNRKNEIKWVLCVSILLFSCLCEHFHLSKRAEGGRGGICRLSLQPKNAAGNFADWLSINQRGKNESVGALLVGLKSNKLPALQGRRLFSLPNWSSLLEKKVELTEEPSGLLFTFRRFRNVLVAWTIKTLFTFFSPNMLDPSQLIITSTAWNNCSNYQPAQSFLWREVPLQRRQQITRHTAHMFP